MAKPRSLSTQSVMAGEVGPACGDPRVGVVGLRVKVCEHSCADACHLKVQGAVVVLWCCEHKRFSVSPPDPCLGAKVGPSGG